MKGDFHVRFCERLAGETPACLLGRTDERSRSRGKTCFYFALQGGRKPELNWGAEVIIRISVHPLTVGVSPNCVQLTPQLRQAAGTCVT